MIERMRDAGIAGAALRLRSSSQHDGDSERGAADAGRHTQLLQAEQVQSFRPPAEGELLSLEWPRER